MALPCVLWSITRRLRYYRRLCFCCCSTAGTIELFLTPPSTEQETFLKSCKCEALSSRPDSRDGTEGEQRLTMQQRFIAHCAVKRWRVKS